MDAMDIEHSTPSSPNIRTIIAAANNGKAWAIEMVESSNFTSMIKNDNINPKSLADNTVYALIVIGICYIEGIGAEKNTTMAEFYLEKANYWFPKNIKVLHLLGYLNYLYIGDQVVAAKYYKRTININPEYSPSLQNLAIIYHCGKGVEPDHDRALKYIKRAIKSNPNDANIHNTFGAMHMYGINNIMNYTMAHGYFTRAVEIDTEHHCAWSNLGNLHMGKLDNNPVEALRCYYKAKNPSKGSEAVKLIVRCHERVGISRRIISEAINWDDNFMGEMNKCLSRW